MGVAVEAVIVTVGDELLHGFAIDTNSAFLAGRAFAAGVPVHRIEIVGDEPEVIAHAIDRAVSEPRVGRIVVGGGLGPTEDDRTAAGVALALGRPLAADADALAHIQGILDRMHAAGWIETATMNDAHRKMALVPAGMQVLENRRGMAPALACRIRGDDRWLFVLPGVPREFTTIVTEVLMPRFFSGAVAPDVIEVRYRATPEASLAGTLDRIAAEFPGVHIGSYPQSETRELVIRLIGNAGDGGAGVIAAAGRLRQLRPP